MMTKHPTHRRALLYYGLSIPLLAVLLSTVSFHESFPSSIREAAGDPGVSARFPGCEDQGGSLEEKQDCANRKLLEFVFTNLKYPAKARLASIEGTVIVQFDIDEEGNIADPKAIRGIGGGCEEEVLRVVGMMPEWIPAKTGGKAVKSQFTLPVRFALPQPDVGFVTVEKLPGQEEREAVEQAQQGEAFRIWNEKPEHMEIAGQDTIITSEVFRVVEEMPRFPGCEELEAGLAEKKACADKRMLEFIYRNIRYPEVARKAGIEGTVVVSFIIEKDGSVIMPEVKRGIGGGCEEEVLRLVEMMPRWTPGRQRGSEVRVQFVLPVRFKLPEEPGSTKTELEISEFQVSPNPSTGRIFLKFNAPAGGLQVSVYDLQGKRIFDQVIPDFLGQFSQEIDLSGAAKGPCIIQIRQGDRASSKKMIIE